MSYHLDINGNEITDLVCNNGIVTGTLRRDGGDSPLGDGEGCTGFPGVWDENTGRCTCEECGEYNPHGFILSTDDENGSLFHVDDNETCRLKVSFDILIEFNCDDLIGCGSNGLSDIFTGLNLSTNLTYIEYGVPITFHNEEILNITNFNEYISGNTNTGIILDGGNCPLIINTIQGELGEDCVLITESTFNSDWLHVEYLIDNEGIINAINNNEIKFGISEESCPCNHSILLDNIKMIKECSETRTDSRLVNTCPGFDLVREIDNKKSWVNLNTQDARDYELESRDTHYNVNHERLVINTKELDLNLDGSNVIECGVLDYIQSNDCVLDVIINPSVSAPTTTNRIYKGHFHTKRRVNIYHESDLVITTGAGRLFTYMTQAPYCIPSLPGTNNLREMGSIVPMTNSTVLCSTSPFYRIWDRSEIGIINVNQLYPVNTYPLEFCINIPTTKTYYLNYFSTNSNTLYIDGELLFDGSIYNEPINGKLYLMPIHLSSGEHIIKTTEFNQHPYSDNGFLFEVYDNTYSELVNITDINEFNVVVSSSELIGQPYNELKIGCDTPTTINNETTLNDLLTTNLSTITDVQSFIEVIREELVDVKNRKVLQSYPTMRWLYEGYLGLTTNCGIGPNQYTYCDLNTFTNLVNKYWYELFEQVIPTTSIWGATTTYRNTVFDQEKFQYKKYGIRTCETSDPCPYVETTGDTINVDYRSFSVNISGGSEFDGTVEICDPIPMAYESCLGINVDHIDYLSSFIGRVATTPTGGSNFTGWSGDLIISEIP